MELSELESDRETIIKNIYDWKRRNHEIRSNIICKNPNIIEEVVRYISKHCIYDNGVEASMEYKIHKYFSISLKGEIGTFDIMFIIDKIVYNYKIDLSKKDIKITKINDANAIYYISTWSNDISNRILNYLKLCLLEETENLDLLMQFIGTNHSYDTPFYLEYSNRVDFDHGYIYYLAEKLKKTDEDICKEKSARTVLSLNKEELIILKQSLIYYAKNYPYAGNASNTDTRKIVNNILNNIKE